jgi:hypothetical protein
MSETIFTQEITNNLCGCGVYGSTFFPEVKEIGEGQKV